MTSAEITQTLKEIEVLQAMLARIDAEIWERRRKLYEGNA